MRLSKRKYDRRLTGVFIFLIAACAAGVCATSYAHHLLAAGRPAQTVLILFGTAALFAALAASTLRALRREEEPEKPAWYYPAMAAALTLALSLVSYFFAGMWPFGENTCVMSDMYSQYMPLYAYFRSVLRGEGGSLLNSLQMGMGLSMVPTIGYYLASPLNLLTALFPREYMAECFLLIITCKTVIAAAAFAACAQYLSGRRSVVSVLTALLYATSMFFVAYSWNLMWFDVVMFVPLAVLSLERLLRGGKPLLYILTLAYTLFANFYAAYMLCLFLVLYFFAWCLREGCGGRRFWNRAVRFGVCSALGGCLAACMVLPTWLGLKLTSAAGEKLPELKANFELLELYGRHFFGVVPTELHVTDLPNIACGVLPMLALPLYAMAGRIPLRRRLTYLGLWAILSASMALNIPNLVWHGMHGPNGLPYRYAFLYVFVVLLMTHDLLCHLDSLRLPQVLGAGTALVAYVLVMEKVSTQDIPLTSVYLTAVLLVIYTAILALAASRRLRAGAVAAVLLFACSAEALFSADETRGQLADSGFLTKHDGYLFSDSHQLLGEMGAEAAGLIRAEGPFFQRVDSSERFTRMDGALYGYNGLSIFCSTYYYATTKTMEHLGFACNTVNSHYLLGYLPTLESLLGARYYISSYELPYEPGLTEIARRAKGEVSWLLYRNDDALGAGFVGTDALRSWRSTSGDPVESQNSLYQALTGDSRQVLVPNREAQQTAGCAASVNASRNGAGFTAHCAKAGDSSDITVTVTTPGQLYFFVDCQKATKIEVVGAKSQIEKPKEPTFINYGPAAAGDTVTVRVSADQQVSGTIYALTLNEQVFDKAVSALKAGGYQVDSYSDTRLHGTVTAPEGGGVLLTTLSYDAGWEASLDGEKVRTRAVDEGLLAVDLPAGTHTLELTFHTRGLKSGLMLSLAGVFGTALLLLLRRRFGLWGPDALADGLPWKELPEPEPEPAPEPEPESEPESEPQAGREPELPANFTEEGDAEK